MKLYATVTSERGGREARKGGDKWLEIEVRGGNNLLRRFIIDYQGARDFTITEKDDKDQTVQVTHL